MITFKNEGLDKPASEKQMQYLSDLLAQYVREQADREPTEKGMAFLAGMKLPERALTNWEASSCITVFRNMNPITAFRTEYERKAASGKLTSASHGAAMRSVFPEAYKVLYS